MSALSSKGPIVGRLMTDARIRLSEKSTLTRARAYGANKRLTASTLTAFE